MKGFDQNLLHNTEIVDMLLGAVGGDMPKKRLLLVDYKENGADMHISEVAYPYDGMTDQALLSDLIIQFAGEGKIICSVVELDKDGRPLKLLYLAPECVNEIMQEGEGRKYHEKTGL